MLGAVEEASSPRLQPNEAFIMGGRPVRVKRIHQKYRGGGTGARRTGKNPALDGQQDAADGATRPGRTASCGANCDAACEQSGADGCQTILWNRLTQWTTMLRPASPISSSATCQRLARSNRFARAGGTSHQRPQHAAAVHVVAGRAVNRSLAWVAGARLASGRSVVANFDDHSFLLSMDARIEVDAEPPA